MDATPIESRADIPKLVADRAIADLRLGASWEPSLAKLMLDHPHSDDEFVVADPSQVCKTCGRAPGSRNHEGSASHSFEPRGPFSEAEMEEAKVGWRLSVATLPTAAALTAWNTEHLDKLIRMATLFNRCRVTLARDIEQLGCTGAHTRGLSIDDIQFLRLGLAGSGAGLPCFVPPTRYCLVHGVSGGLQEGQAQLHAEAVPSISRELTAAERTHDRLVSEVADSGEGSNVARRMLRGKALPEGWTKVDDEGDEAQAARLGQYFDTHEVTEADSTAVEWTCPSHKKLTWACRYCAAQALVEGELEPVYRLAVGTAAGDRVAVTDECAAGALEQEIIEEDGVGTTGLDVYVRVATYTRKLARNM